MLCQACGQNEQAPPPIANFEQLVRLQESLDRIEGLLSPTGGASAQGGADIRQELAVVQEFLESSGQGQTPPFASKLELIIAILTESEAEPSVEQSARVKQEILAMRSLLNGPTGAGPGGPGPGGPPPSMGSSTGAPDAKKLERDLERQQREVQEKVWRARASATRAAVESTRKAYDQAMSVRPGPGDSPQLIAQVQSAAKAAMEAAEQAQADLREEARRASVPPGWLR